jgi:hypothetical protein
VETCKLVCSSTCHMYLGALNSTMQDLIHHYDVTVEKSHNGGMKRSFGSIKSTRHVAIKCGVYTTPVSCARF